MSTGTTFLDIVRAQQSIDLERIEAEQQLKEQRNLAESRKQELETLEVGIKHLKNKIEEDMLILTRLKEDNERVGSKNNGRRNGMLHINHILKLAQGEKIKQVAQQHQEIKDLNELKDNFLLDSKDMSVEFIQEFKCDSTDDHPFLETTEHGFYGISLHPAAFEEEEKQLSVLEEECARYDEKLHLVKIAIKDFDTPALKRTRLSEKEGTNFMINKLQEENAQLERALKDKENQLHQY